MKTEDAATEICKILETVQPHLRVKVLELVRQDYCFLCGLPQEGPKGCECWNQK